MHVHTHTHPRGVKSAHDDNARVSANLFNWFRACRTIWGLNAHFKHLTRGHNTVLY